MNNLLQGVANEYVVLGTVQASEDDLSLIAKYIGATVTAEEVAVVEAVAFDDSKNANGWQVADLDGIDCLGASLNYDHSTSQRDSFGVVFACQNDETPDKKKRKIVKAAIPKGDKTANVLTDLKFKVAQYTSPMIKPTEWADEKSQIVKAGRLVHLSFVQNPAFGESNRVLSLAAKESDEDKLFADLGRRIHSENVTAATRLAERRAGGWTKEQREQARQKYNSMDPMLLQGEVLPMLRELTGKTTTTSQKTLSAVTADSTIDTPNGLAKQPAYPVFANPDGLKLNIGEQK